MNNFVILRYHYEVVNRYWNYINLDEIQSSVILASRGDSQISVNALVKSEHLQELCTSRADISTSLIDKLVQNAKYTGIDLTALDNNQPVRFYQRDRDWINSTFTFENWPHQIVAEPGKTKIFALGLYSHNSDYKYYVSNLSQSIKYSYSNNILVSELKENSSIGLTEQFKVLFNLPNNILNPVIVTTEDNSAYYVAIENN